ncbi:hypothetical protein [Nocardia crassostreae]|uniref:hypothetical protein n=1 Tax=Nocardia crassostreae TaxID=53428 RepID=UPI000AF809C9|nr:hypothetical protein [Nocardia crassostreae]
MADRVEVDTVKLRKAAYATAAINGRISGALTTLKANLAARGAPWGDDKFGKTFADGAEQQPGYLAIRDTVTTGIGAMADTFAGFADGQFTAADKFDGADGFSRDSFDRKQ